MTGFIIHYCQAYRWKAALVGIETAIVLIQHRCAVSLPLVDKTSHPERSLCHTVGPSDSSDVRNNNLIGGAVAKAIISIDTILRLVHEERLSYEEALDDLMEDYASRSPEKGDMDGC